MSKFTDKIAPHEAPKSLQELVIAFLETPVSDAAVKDGLDVHSSNPVVVDSILPERVDAETFVYTDYQSILLALAGETQLRNEMMTLDLPDPDDPDFQRFKEAMLAMNPFERDDVSDESLDRLEEVLGDAGTAKEEEAVSDELQRGNNFLKVTRALFTAARGMPEAAADAAIVKANLQQVADIFATFVDEEVEFVLGVGPAFEGLDGAIGDNQQGNEALVAETRRMVPDLQKIQSAALGKGIAD
jgi:hypothetical protein